MDKFIIPILVFFLIISFWGVLYSIIQYRNIKNEQEEKFDILKEKYGEESNNIIKSLLNTLGIKTEGEENEEI